MNNKLLEHFKRMQLELSTYLEQPGYDPEAFMSYLIQALDGPEQREAEASVGNTYIEDALRTESGREVVWLQDQTDAENVRDTRLLHAAMGLTTEAGEFLDALKKHLFYGKPLDLVNLREEIGDIMWYLAIACSALDTDFEQEQARNIAKLKARYPDKFDAVQAVERDLDAEREILER